ncbi:glycosyltransferase family 2 protein [Solirhodobacter olei]|uniref:glycosyltransferase family 2 protein n=1 Tax=Solirhodobacter olei TaxID=2493082 RepID=UPI000FDA2D3D|nr:glycosyltransferase family A protein [Solirhodobacter olei]
MGAAPLSDRPGGAVIIPHFNDPLRLERCLSALTANDLTGVEVVVVDNDSATPPDGVIGAFSGVRLVTEPERGAAAARNRGLAETSAPVVLFLDADCVPAPDWVVMARRVAVSADLGCGRVDLFDETPPPRSGAEAFETVFAFRFRDYVERQGFAGAGNLVIHRGIFDAVGGFRPGVSEDRDWSMRAVAAGYHLVYAEAMRVGHPTRADWPALRAKWRRLTAETWRFERQRRGWLARPYWLGRAVLVAASALPHLARVARDPRLRDATERRRAAAVLVRLRLARAFWMLGQVFRA